MSAVIQTEGESQSKVFQPRAKFGLNVRALSDAIAGEWFLYYTSDPSRDDDQWQKAHATAFSDTNYRDTFEIPEGFYCKVFGGTGTNIEVEIGYIPTIPPKIYNIEKDILADE